MPKLRDVAHLAGVSVGTVSHVLNGAVPVSPALRERVLRAAEELDYRPDLVARGLRSRRTGIIGLVIADIRNAFYTELSSGVQQTAERQGYRVMIYNTYDSPVAEAEHLATLRTYHVDGVIITPTAGGHEGLADLVRADFPVVIANEPLEGDVFTQVNVDNYGGARLVTEHFLAGGRTRVGLAFALRGFCVERDRLAGCRDALAAAGEELDESLICYAGTDYEATTSTMRDFLSAHRDLSALFCFTAASTLGALLAARELGIAIPGQLALIGSGNMRWAPLLNPPLTYLKQPTYEMGRTAVGLLLDLIQGNKRRDDSSRREPVHSVLPVELIHGGTCGCL